MGEHVVRKGIPMPHAPVTRPAILLSAMLATLVLTSCGSTAGETPATGEGTAPAESSVPAEPADSTLETYAYAFSSVLSDVRDYQVSGTTATFFFDTPSAGGEEVSHCLIAHASIGSEGDYTVIMVYPDGEFDCAEVLR